MPPLGIAIALATPAWAEAYGVRYWDRSTGSRAPIPKCLQGCIGDRQRPLRACEKSTGDRYKLVVKPIRAEALDRCLTKTDRMLNPLHEHIPDIVVVEWLFERMPILQRLRNPLYRVIKLGQQLSIRGVKIT